MRTQFEKKTFVRALPENVCREDVPYFHKIRNYDCPALFIHQFKSVNILPDSTLFKGIFPLDLSFPFFKKRLKHHNKKGILYIILKWKRIKLKENLPFVIIHDPWTKNYYHWITQALPRLLLVKMINQPFILLLPEDHQTDFHIASLKLMEVHTWRIIERGEKYFNIHNL